MSHTRMCALTKRVAEGAMSRTDKEHKRLAVAFSQEASAMCPACKEKKVKALGAGK